MSSKSIDIEKIKLLLENEAFTSELIEQSTGVNKGMIDSLRAGEINVEDLDLQTAFILSRLCDGINISYDYENLLEEFRADLYEFSPKLVAIVREDRGVYKPIIDYYLPQSFNKINEPCEIVYAKDVLREMEEMNKLI
ncbi:MAG: hypothetical protein ACLUJM_08975 [Finegoldia sp.]|uniref:hypothetical protein n=1 Tax=Finegoldia sp. TaxID=1981334 RepID=UPI0039966859